MDFQGKVILVTGAGRGIGAAIATAFAREGGAVVVNYLRDEASARRTVDACQAAAAGAGGDAWAVRANVCVQTEAQALVAQVLAEAGRIDVVVNNAFRAYAFDPEQRQRFWELDWQHYQDQFEGSVRAAYHMSQAVLPHFRLRAQGSLINLVSDLVARPVVPYHDYTTAKSALVGFSRNLAAELGPLGVRVNCVAPGLVYPTDASRATREDVKGQIAEQTPLRRIATPEDVAGPVLFLASEWSRFMTGQVLYVDGGLVMK